MEGAAAGLGLCVEESGDMAAGGCGKRGGGVRGGE